MKRKYMIILLLALIIGGAAFMYTIAQRTPAEKAEKILDKYSETYWDVKAIYYNEKEKGCVVLAEANLMEELICIHLDTREVAYKSVYEDYTTEGGLWDPEAKETAELLEEYPYEPEWAEQYQDVQAGWVKQYR